VKETSLHGKRLKSRRMPKRIQEKIRRELREGELVKHGYSMHKPAKLRHQALAKSVEEDGALTVYRRLNLLYVWNKNQNPKLARIAKSDMEWVGETYGVKQDDGYTFTKGR